MYLESLSIITEKKLHLLNLQIKSASVSKCQMLTVRYFKKSKHKHLWVILQCSLSAFAKISIIRSCITNKRKEDVELHISLYIHRVYGSE